MVIEVSTVAFGVRQLITALQWPNFIRLKKPKISTFHNNNE